MTKKKNLTKKPQVRDNDPVAEAAERGRTQPDPDAGKNLLTSIDEDRLRDDAKFQKFVSKNLWENRREKDWPWKTDVVEFLHTTYADWLKKGLYRSDFRLLDPKLYAMLNKYLHALGSDEAKLQVLEDLGILPEFGEAAIERIEDPEVRAAVGAIRGYHRERAQKYRATIKNTP